MDEFNYSKLESSEANNNILFEFREVTMWMQDKITSFLAHKRYKDVLIGTTVSNE